MSKFELLTDISNKWFDYICNFLILLIDHYVLFSISYLLKILVWNIWENFDKRRGRSPLFLLKMQRSATLERRLSFM